MFTCLRLVWQVDACLRCLAVHLLHLVHDSRLALLIAASAQTVAERQDVDSVPLVDDLRFWVDTLHPLAAMSGATLALSVYHK